MNSDSLNVTHSLSIDSVELYTTINSNLKLATKGQLNLLYIQAYNCFILQINDFRYCLYETIPILVSQQEAHCIRSYVIPNINGNYIIKVTTTSNLKVLDDLESIFKKHSRLAYKTRRVGEASTDHTDLDEIQCNVDEDSSPKSAFARSERFSLGTPIEMKSPKKSLFRSLFSKKSKKLCESAPGKYMSKSTDKKDALLFRNSIMMCGVVTSLDEKYVQGLIMVAKEIGRKSEENDKRGSSSPTTPQEMFQFAADEIRQCASDTFYGMDQSLSIMRSDSRNAKLIGF